MAAGAKAPPASTLGCPLQQRILWGVSQAPGVHTAPRGPHRGLGLHESKTRAASTLTSSLESDPLHSPRSGRPASDKGSTTAHRGRDRGPRPQQAVPMGRKQAATMSGFPWKVPPSSHAPGRLCTREKWKRASTRHAHKRVWRHYSCQPKYGNDREVPRADGRGAAVERSDTRPWRRHRGALVASCQDK